MWPDVSKIVNQGDANAALPTDVIVREGAVVAGAAVGGAPWQRCSCYMGVDDAGMETADAGKVDADV